jgi:hypothetical protein
VESDGEAVRYATVTLSGAGVSTSGMSNYNGIVTIPVNPTGAGTITATATKTGFNSATATVTVTAAKTPDPKGKRTDKKKEDKRQEAFD